MIDLVIDILSSVSIGLGILALLIGALGLVRLPDVYCRIHAVGMMDTAGAGLIILGMVLHAGLTLVSAKLVLIGVFMFFTSPIATHAVAQVAHKMGVVPVGRIIDDSPGKRAKTSSAPKNAGAKR